MRHMGVAASMVFKHYLGVGFVVKTVPFCMNFSSSLEGSVGSKHVIKLCCDFMFLWPVIQPFNTLIEMHLLKTLK